MPFKELAYKYYYNLGKNITNQTNIKSFNTIKKIDSELKGCLTDYFIFKEYEKVINHQINKVLIYGSGAMGKLAYDFFDKKEYSCEFLTKENIESQISSYKDKDQITLINASPIKLEDNIDSDSIDYKILDLPVRRGIVFTNKNYYSGYWATKIQFRHQFNFYVGKMLNEKEIDNACKYLFGY